MERSESILTFISAPVVVVALLLAGIAFWGANKQILGLFHDDAIYVIAGKALASGNGYRIESLPGAPAQTKYPFLFSFLLSILWRLAPSFPKNIALLKSLNIAILVGIFLTAVTYSRRNFSSSSLMAVLFAALVCTNPIIFGYTDYVLSDLLLVLLTLIALTLCSRTSEPFPFEKGGLRGILQRTKVQIPPDPPFSKGGSYASMAHLLVLAGVVGSACLTRTAALPLVFAGVLYALVRRGWRGAMVFVLGVGCLLAPWFIWVWSHAAAPVDSLFAYYSGYDPTGAELFSPLKHLTVIAGNARYLIDSFELLYLTPLVPGLAIILGLLTATGMVVSIKRDEIISLSLFLSSLALLLVWPFHPGRYLAPLIPILLLFLFRGCARARMWLASESPTAGMRALFAKVAWFPLLIILALNAFWLSGYLFAGDARTTRGLYGNRVPYSWTGFEETFAWIREQTPRDAVLATAYDPMYYLYTGRRAIRPALHRPATYFYPYGNAQPDVGTLDEIKPQLAKLRVNYLIIDPLQGYAEAKASLKLFDELVKSYGEQAINVFTSADGLHRVYRLGNL
jgi:hypothetical protein